MNAPIAPPRWSIVVPYYNEEPFIERTIACAIALRGPAFKLILVNNASDDRSEELCRAMLAGHPEIDVEFVFETKPGPSHALEAGLAHVDTPFVALWNADTWYPVDYLARAESLLDKPGIVAAMAVDIYAPANHWYGWLTRVHKRNMAALMSRQTHTGTYGQSFRTEVLRAAGGPRSENWPWVLDDHELMQRVFKFGRSRYHADFWCMPSARRGRNAHVRWSLFERIMYHVTPYPLKNWFFYDFLAKRFAARGMRNANLRDRDWVEGDTPLDPTKTTAAALAFDAGG